MVSGPISDEYDSIRRRARRVSVFTILALWLLYAISLTAARIIQGVDSSAEVLLPRSIVIAVGIGITFAIDAVLARTKLDHAFKRVCATVLAGAIGCTLHTAANNFVFYEIFQLGSSSDMTLADQATAILSWFWLYLCIVAVLIGQRYSTDLAERDLRLAWIESTSRMAELKALRYQINPHFLFNSLNSIAALIGQSQSKAAQGMVENLSDFLRASLTLDATDDIPLEQEVELQKMYLAVEFERFPDRLRVHTDVPADLRKALIPSLILQPLIENSIKHAVGSSTDVVTLSVTAERAGTRLRLTVSDDGKGTPTVVRQGAGVGLSNVRARLHARFGEAARFEAGPQPQGGYATALTFPLVEPANAS